MLRILERGLALSNFGEILVANEQRDRELAASVRREIERELAQAYQEFQPSFFDHPVFVRQEDDGEDHGGWKIFRWDSKRGVWFFLVLGFEGRLRPNFFLELYWNTIDACPFVSFVGSRDAEPWLHEKNRCSLIADTARRGMETVFWTVGSNPAYAPATVVSRAVAKLKQFASPITAKVIERHGRNAGPS